MAVTITALIFPPLAISIKRAFSSIREKPALGIRIQSVRYKMETDETV